MSNKPLPDNYYGTAPVGRDADPADVATIEAILDASYQCISGPAGHAPDWNRMRTLFLPDARSIRTGPVNDIQYGYKMMQNEEYIDQMDHWLTENGFFESEIHRIVEQYGNIAQVFSTYESRRRPDEEPFMRGINSFQLFHDGSRWWIVNILWRHESPDLPLPQKYLP